MCEICGWYFLQLKCFFFFKNKTIGTVERYIKIKMIKTNASHIIQNSTWLRKKTNT